jgi:hypothetical protein
MKIQQRVTAPERAALALSMIALGVFLAGEMGAVVRDGMSPLWASAGLVFAALALAVVAAYVTGRDR